MLTDKLRFERSFIISLSDIDCNDEDAYDDISSVVNNIYHVYTRGYMTRYLEGLNENNSEIVVTLIKFAKECM